MTDNNDVVVHAPDIHGGRQITAEGRVLGRALREADVEYVMQRFKPDADFKDLRVDWGNEGGAAWGTTSQVRARRVTLAAMLSGSTFAFAVLTYIGKIDASGALTFTGRFTGGLVLLAAAVILLGTVCTLDYWGRRRFRYSGALVVLGAVTALVTNTMMLAVQLFTGTVLRATVFIWPTVIVWAIWGLSELYRLDVFADIPHLQGLAIGVVVTSIAGLVNFSYVQMYQPYASPVLLPVTTSFGKPEFD